MTLVWPPATVNHPTRSSFTAEDPITRVWLTARLRVLVVNSRPNPGTSASLQRTGPERLAFLGVEGAESRRQLIGAGQPVIETHAELIEVPTLLFDGGEVLECRTRGGERDMFQEGRCDWVDPARRNPISANGVQTPVRGTVNGSHTAPRPEKSPPRTAAAAPRMCGLTTGASAVLVAAEEEGPVLHERLADRDAELVPA